MATGREFFETVPCCASILDNPHFRVSNKLSTFADPFFTDTIRRNRGVVDILCLHRVHGSDRSESSNNQDYDCVLLLRVGEGIVGQSSLAHGGFLATVLDEVSGRAMSLNDVDGGLGTVTAYMNISYRKPLVAPTVFLAMGKLVKTEGRKLYVDAVIKDDTGDTCTSAVSLFIRRNANSL